MVRWFLAPTPFSRTLASVWWGVVLASFSSTTSFATSSRSYYLEAAGTKEDGAVLINFSSTAVCFFRSIRPHVLWARLVPTLVAHNC